MKRAPSRTVFVVSHTHWDREWYKPFHEFRVELVEVLKKALDLLETDPEFRHFHLDGQAILIEDFLEICPEHESRLRGLAQSGAISVGPWYVLADEFLVSPEALVRNLMVGNRIARRFKAPETRVAYVPDAFGHVAQLPQIVTLAGLDTVLFSRGGPDELDDLGLEFRWRAPNGSHVTAIHQWGGYCRGGALGFLSDEEARVESQLDLELAVTQVEKILSELVQRSNGAAHLLSNGCDHLPPQPRLGEIVHELGRKFPSIEFVHDSLDAFASRVKTDGLAKKSFAGELRSGRHQLILPGVWSSRNYLKRENHDSQLLLASYLEPLAVMLWSQGIAEYPAAILSYAWRRLLQNHPHDSICGCSVDAVHREMLVRFAQVRETCQAALSRLLRIAMPRFSGQGDGAQVEILVANTLVFVRTAVVERLVVLSGQVDARNLVIADAGGRRVPSVVTQAETVPRRWGPDLESMVFPDEQRAAMESFHGSTSHDDPHEEGEDDTLVWVRLLASHLPPTGYSSFQVRVENDATPAMLSQAEKVVARKTEMENELVKVVVYGNGTFDLLDKNSGVTHCGLNVLRDMADAGDEYNHAPLGSGQAVSSGALNGAVRLVEQNDLVGIIEANYELILPRGLAEDRSRRSDETVCCAVSARVALEYGSPIVTIQLRVNNLASDHRLQACFPTELRTENVFSDGAFFIDQRPLDIPSDPKWVELSGDTLPQQDFSAIGDGSNGLALFAKGLHEISPLKTERGRGLALTLLRSVGWLSRDDVPARKGRPAGPMLATPEAQCLGLQTFDYAVMPFSGTHVDAELKRWSTLYRVQPLSLQGARHGAADAGAVALDSSDVCVSAIKRHDQRDSIVVRMYNLNEVPTTATVEVGFLIREVWCLDLLENRLHSIETGIDAFDVPFGQHEIVTVEIVV